MPKKYNAGIRRVNYGEDRCTSATLSDHATRDWKQEARPLHFGYAQKPSSVTTLRLRSVTTLQGTRSKTAALRLRSETKLSDHTSATLSDHATRDWKQEAGPLHFGYAQ